MSIDKLIAEAELLENLLIKYQAKEPLATSCLNELAPIFDQIKNRLVTQPYKDIPCAYYFHEGDLRKYPDLEQAYSEFKLTATGYDREKLNKYVMSQKTK